MSFKDALHVVSTDMFLHAVLPGWAMGLTKRFRVCRQAITELQVRASLY